MNRGPIGGRAGRRLQRFVVRTDAGRLRPLWSALYEGAARALAAYLRRGTPGAAVYLARTLGTHDAVHGLSDIDLIVVFPGNPRERGAEHKRVRARWHRLRRLVPPLDLLFTDTAFYEDGDLREAMEAPILTYGLGAEGATKASTFGHAPFDDLGLRARPGVLGPTRDWRRIAGPERLPRPPAFGDEQRRIAAWLELQFWWSYAFEMAREPDRPWVAYAAVKLVAEPARILLALAGEDVRAGRREVLEMALRRLPGEEPAVRAALELRRALAGGPDPRDAMSEVFPGFVRLSTRIAGVLADAVEPAGTTEVRLSGDGDELVLPLAGSGPLVPLADWRAVALPGLPDESLSRHPGDPRDWVTVGAVAADGERGPYPVLRTDGLLVLPALGVWSRSLLRAVQCGVTDPVSFALCSGGDRATFSNAPGWSARDWARRGVAEHRSWFAAPTDRPRPRLSEWLDGDSLTAPGAVRMLAKLLTAARAALFMESIDHGAPDLPLTVAAVADRLGARGSGAGAVAQEAVASYREGLRGTEPAPRTVEALREVVLAMPPYARGGGPGRTR